MTTYSKSQRTGNDQAMSGRIKIHLNPQPLNHEKPRIPPTRRERLKSGKTSRMTRTSHEASPTINRLTKIPNVAGVNTNILRANAGPKKLHVINAERWATLNLFAETNPKLHKLDPERVV